MRSSMIPRGRKMQNKIAIVRQREGHMRIRDGMQQHLLLDVGRTPCSVRRNFRRAGTLKNSERTSITVPERRRDHAPR
jgi:hypothetical protein